MLQGDVGVAHRAKRLRKEMTLPENMLWKYLRGNPSGIKFRRQHPSGPYVADFYCHKARLIIEVDGIVHDMSNNPARDTKRDAWFAERNIEVMRIKALDVMRDAMNISQSIIDYARDKIAEEK